MKFESRKTSLTILLLPFLLSFLSPIVSASVTQDSTASSATQDSEGGLTPWETWDDDDDYISCETNAEGNKVGDYVFPWGGDEMMLSLIHI